MADGVQNPDYSKILPNVVREGITTEELLHEYNKWARSYDQDLDKLGYKAYQQAADKLSELIPAEARGKVKILDVGAGTGLLGLKLAEAGFVHIDALDPSKDMLDEARRKGVYEDLYEEFLTENPLNIPKDTYDAVVGSGMFGYSAAPYTSIYEMIRLTKPGGFVVLSIREDVATFPEYKDMEPTMERLEKEGRWKSICRVVYPNFFKDSNGLLYAFQILANP